MSMSQSVPREIVWLLMLIPFGVVLGIGAFFFYCAWRRASLFVGEKITASFSAPFRSSAFEQPARWLAVQAVNTSVVHPPLRVNRPARCSWKDGLTAEHEDKLFISPPISGWVLVVGSGLPEPS